LRSQDGYKAYLLCDECEGLFNSWETDFANSYHFTFLKEKCIILQKVLASLETLL